ncbi:MAG: radical SAM family heme chaperone HemW [Ginsengibacter sp.]
MAGIYLHIPFCKQACYYCNFYFSTSLALKEELIRALVREIELRNEDPGNEINIIFPDEVIETIYFGGGTPSLLSQDDLNSILSSLKENYHIAGDPEITLEANPDDITIEKLNEWRNAGINRLSIGIQSFIERDLKWMNRAHNAVQAYDCIRLARESGFHNFSIDLIFGTPGLSDEEWVKNVQTVIDLKVPHISSYALTVEPKTALQKMIALKKKEDVNTDVQANQYMILMKMMREAGYEHYEISNFSLPGFRSRHNSSYWQGKKYIGIGPSAHSYNGNERTWNKANNSVYIQSLQNGILSFEKEILTDSQKSDEYIMTSLRTIEGMDLQRIENNFSLNERKRIESAIEKEVEREMYFFENDHIILTDEGKLFADRIAVKLFT